MGRGICGKSVPGQARGSDRINRIYKIKQTSQRPILLILSDLIVALT
jgi:hypothetical protein